MPAWLRIEGQEELHSMPVARNFCVGRNADCDLQLDDPRVSRNHAIVQHTGKDTYYLIDIASRNGCFVNNKRINAPTLLRNGDRIRIGDTNFEFLLEQTSDTRLDPNETLVSTMEIDQLDIQEITILVADIRGFTTMTEELPITTLTMIMNHWFTEVSECISNNKGILDKFIGDSVYARWNSPDEDAEPVLHALQAACELHHISEEMNRMFTEIPFPIKIGVGINTGHAALDIGIENTAMGDAVNLAFRLEDQSKVIGKNIILSQESYKLLPEKLWDENRMQIYVKGKKGPVSIVGVDFAPAEEFLRSLA